MDNWCQPIRSAPNSAPLRGKTFLAVCSGVAVSLRSGRTVSADQECAEFGAESPAAGEPPDRQVSADQECAEFGADPSCHAPHCFRKCQPIRSAPNSAPRCRPQSHSHRRRVSRSGVRRIRRRRFSGWDGLAAPVSADQECAEFGANSNRRQCPVSASVSRSGVRRIRRPRLLQTFLQTSDVSADQECAEFGATWPRPQRGKPFTCQPIRSAPNSAPIKAFGLQLPAPGCQPIRSAPNSAPWR